MPAPVPHDEVRRKMLVLSRKIEEEVYITFGEVLVRVKVTESRPGKVKLAIDAPPEVGIHRKESYLNLPDRPKIDGGDK
jgi:carbon storage regulator CsrA